MLRVPVHNNTLLPTKTAVDSIWRLEEQLRGLLHLHREGQRSFAQKSPSTIQKATKAKAKPAVHIAASA
jgi:hypothetical protein